LGNGERGLQRAGIVVGRMVVVERAWHDDDDFCALGGFGGLRVAGLALHYARADILQSGAFRGVTVCAPVLLSFLSSSYQNSFENGGVRGTPDTAQSYAGD
jgi:hypothetical protein